MRLVILPSPGVASRRYKYYCKPPGHGQCHSLGGVLGYALGDLVQPRPDCIQPLLHPQRLARHLIVLLLELRHLLRWRERRGWAGAVIVKMGLGRRAWPAASSYCRLSWALLCGGERRRGWSSLKLGVGTENARVQCHLLTLLPLYLRLYLPKVDGCVGRQTKRLKSPRWMGALVGKQDD